MITSHAEKTVCLFDSSLCTQPSLSFTCGMTPAEIANAVLDGSAEAFLVFVFNLGEHSAV